MKVTDPHQTLQLGGLVVSDGFDPVVSADGSWSILMLSSDADFGSPQPIVVAVKSLLQDGSLVAKTGDDNREVFFRVQVDAETSVGLAAAEAAIVAEVGGRNTLTWTPPDGWGPPTVFDVLTSSTGFVFDDEAELLTQWTFGIRLTCLPFARSAVETVDAGLVSGASPTTVVIDDFSTDTTPHDSPDWVVPYAPTIHLQVREGYLEVAEGLRNFVPPVDFSATHYLSFDVEFYPAVPGQPRHYAGIWWVEADGIRLQQVAYRAIAAGVVRYTYFCDRTAVTTLTVRSDGYINGGPTDGALHISNVKRTNIAPMSGTSRQKVRTLAIGGTVRSEGALAVEHPTQSLGDVLVYTAPALDGGFVPTLRPWSNDATTADATAVSGLRSSVPFTASMPVAAMPRGGYVLMARISGAAATGAPITWTAQTIIGGNFVGTIASGTAYVDLTGSWQIVTLGGTVLPPTDTPVGGAVQIRINKPNSGIVVDEAWLFYVGDGAALTQVACGVAEPSVGGASNRLWIDTATIDRPYPAIWVGSAADRSDARHAGPDASAWNPHQFTPPSTTVFTVTTGAADASISRRGYHRWHTHAGD